jgi:hypothetical protein
MPEEIFENHTDTDLKAEKYLIERLEKMTPGEKLQRMANLCVLARRFLIAGIQSDYPECTTKEELKKRLTARMYGRKTSIKYFAWDPEKEGY